jgi:integration host factor subunit alpha
LSPAERIEFSQKRRFSLTLTKDSIIDSIYSNTDLKRYQTATIFETLFEIVKKTLESGEDVLISGFGKFCVQHKNERRGRNPQTGNLITLGPRKVVTFRCSPVLRDKINGKG